MDEPSIIADVNIHLRVRAHDSNLVDQAAQLVGASRSQFILPSTLNEAKNVLLDQSTVFADAKAFQKVMDWMDAEATFEEIAGMKRILAARSDS